MNKFYEMWLVGSQWMQWNGRKLMTAAAKCLVNWPQTENYDLITALKALKQYYLQVVKLPPWQWMQIYKNEKIPWRFHGSFPLVVKQSFDETNQCWDTCCIKMYNALWQWNVGCSNDEFQGIERPRDWHFTGSAVLGVTCGGWTKVWWYQDALVDKRLDNITVEDQNWEL